MPETTVDANGAALCIDTFGNPAAPAILLIGGAASSMDWWHPSFCESLSTAGRFVIRYDHRDTGRSSSSPAGSPDYTAADLPADAIGILDALDIRSAHLTGVSMGGAIAQRIAIEHPGRVTALTLIATTAITPVPTPLPPPAPRLREKFSAPGPAPDWTDRPTAIAELVAGSRLFNGTLPLDEPYLRALAGRIFDRTTDMAASQTNHWILPDGRPMEGDLSQVKAPTLVLHGTEDPLFPYPHAEALAAAIPGARLIPLEGMGHQLPPRSLWPTVTTHLLSL
jgi:pimeloyl-ACP methyl ester carboxylesterase